MIIPDSKKIKSILAMQGETLASWAKENNHNYALVRTTISRYGGKCDPISYGTKTQKILQDLEKFNQIEEKLNFKTLKTFVARLECGG